ncbi:hypothetical protein GPECTOR_393g211 [Gonium pectorale]|uniref:N-alpha-acetyltransferase 40 n=1 Tax=Gonium pectorale TaxID=33097 RepID=A0A150FWZ5_GONPE|nr:hypothetical protein GPECTOR_393g211 [Gonium pectorale]|eukprot:KXZ41560.1 hypothetical protein GPECTOR_393g211 [Gonium pectorale]
MAPLLISDLPYGHKWNHRFIAKSSLDISAGRLDWAVNLSCSNLAPYSALPNVDARAEKMADLSHVNTRFIFADDLATCAFLAYVAYRIDCDQDRVVLYVYELHVAPFARGRGLGSGLLLTLVALAERLCLDAVVLTVATANAPARKLYKELRFEPCWSDMTRATASGRHGAQRRHRPAPSVGYEELGRATNTTPQHQEVPPSALRAFSPREAMAMERAQWLESGAYGRKQRTADPVIHLGKGGFGVVTDAVSQEFGRVAIKRFMARSSGSKVSVSAALQKNILVATCCPSERLVRLVGAVYGTDGAPAGLVFEAAWGPLDDLYDCDGPPLTDLWGCISLLADAAEGVADMHDRGWLHRDIKPSNMLVLRDCEGYLTGKAADFDLAAYSMDSQPTGAAFGRRKASS